MAYDKKLAKRLRDLLGDRAGVEEKEMFGGLTFTVNGNMACGVTGQALVVRVGPRGYHGALTQPHCRECDFTGRPLRGMVMIDPSGIESYGDLRAWAERGFDFAASLPPK
jgi:hypothetical protein